MDAWMEGSIQGIWREGLSRFLACALSLYCSVFVTSTHNYLSKKQQSFSNFSISTESPSKELPASCPSPDIECTSALVEQRTVILLVMLSSYSVSLTTLHGSGFV